MAAHRPTQSRPQDRATYPISQRIRCDSAATTTDLVIRMRARDWYPWFVGVVELVKSVQDPARVALHAQCKCGIWRKNKGLKSHSAQSGARKVGAGVAVLVHSVELVHPHAVERRRPWRRRVWLGRRWRVRRRVRRGRRWRLNDARKLAPLCPSRGFPVLP